MSIALCQLSAWIDECLKISRINSQHRLQIKQEDNPSLHAYMLFGIEESEGHPLIKYLAWGMREGLMYSVCVCVCVSLCKDSLKENGVAYSCHFPSV